MTKRGSTDGRGRRMHLRSSTSCFRYSRARANADRSSSSSLLESVRKRRAGSTLGHHIPRLLSALQSHTDTPWAHAGDAEYNTARSCPDHTRGVGGRGGGQTQDRARHRRCKDKGARGPRGARAEGSSTSRQKSQNPPACVISTSGAEGGSTAGLWLLFIIFFFSGGGKAREPMRWRFNDLKGTQLSHVKNYSGHTEGRNEAEEVGRGQRKR